MNIILPRESVTYEGPNIVVCEGYGDVVFLERLLTARGVEPFEIGCPSQDQAGVGRDGRSGMEDYLKAVRVFKSRAKNGLDSIAVMIDSDDEPDAALADAKNLLGRSGFPVPEGANEWTREHEQVRAAVVLVPGPLGNGALRQGALEHLLWDVVKERDPNTFRCVEAFATRLGGHEGWSSNKRAKMRVNAAIAGRCKEDPASSLAWVWSNDPGIFPLDHRSFDFISDLFRQVAPRRG
jgi:Protein of unknown function (DUF3226)